MTTPAAAQARGARAHQRMPDPTATTVSAENTAMAATL